MTPSDSPIVDDVANAYRAYASQKRTPTPLVQAQLQRIHDACVRGAKWQPRARSGKPRAHPEKSEQLVLADWLDLRLAECEWCHIPNEALRSWQLGASLKAQGLKAGAPDAVIFKPPPCGGFHGAALELKKPGATYSSVTTEQRAWLASLARLGWATSWHAGADSAIKWLTELGY